MDSYFYSEQKQTASGMKITLFVVKNSACYGQYVSGMPRGCMPVSNAIIISLL